MGKFFIDIRFSPERLKLILILPFLFLSCKLKNRDISPQEINALNLKKGEVVLCGPPDKSFGHLTFDVSCSEAVKIDFNLAVALLHSFEYDEAERVFAKIIRREPSCAMAYWGVAMCNFHPLWAPSDAIALEKGTRAVKIARSLSQKSERESDYVEAISRYYTDWDKLNDHTRCVLFERAMEGMNKKYPQDKEAAIFYALSLDAAADPTDKTYSNQRKAGNILNAIYPGEPDHPGIVHYIIHTYDYPGLAEMALPAARKYASIAPSSAHAQHMPSHIFTRLGLWDESIHSNLMSTAAAKCYAENTDLKGHWDEELHGMDYLEYAYLQKGDNLEAKNLCDYLRTIHEVHPANFKVAYAFAAIPSRYLMENRLWKEAARLSGNPPFIVWKKFPWQEAILHFTRLMGFLHIGYMDSSKAELAILKSIYDTLAGQKDMYKADQVDVQIKSSEAWIFLAKGEKEKALETMSGAADKEDATEKSPVTPGEVIPARELLGHMFLQVKENAKALEAYRADLKRHPNRFNGLYGAGRSAENLGDKEKAKFYYREMVAVCAINSTRPELIHAKLYLKKS